MNDALLIEYLNNLITGNRWRELLGEDTVAGGNGDKYYYELVQQGIPFGVVPNVPVANDGGAQTNNNQNTNNNVSTN